MATGTDAGNRKPPGAGETRRMGDGDALGISEPMFAWAALTGFRYLGGAPDWIPLLVRTNGANAQEVHARLQTIAGEAEHVWHIPVLFLKPFPGLDKLHHFCMLLNWGEKRGKALAVLAMIEKDFGGRYEFGLPVGAGTTVPITPAPKPPATLAPPTAFDIDGPPLAATPVKPAKPIDADVLVGIIDDGLALAHERFRNAAGTYTRIAAAWVQDRGPFGTEYSGKNIDDAVTACTHAGLVDEAEVYRTLDIENYASAVHKPLSRRLAHGTHVMDVAAGYDPGQAPPARPIVTVQLPGRVVRDTGGASLTFWALWGIHFILARSLAMGANPGDVPVVVNLSYGIFDGPHDGTSPFETAVDELVRAWSVLFGNGRLSIVLPAGNNFLWRTHAHFSLPATSTQRLDWRVVPDDRTPSTVQVWLPHKAAHGTGLPDAKMRVTAPDGMTSGWLKVGNPPVVLASPATGQALGRVTFETTAQSQSRPVFTINLLATAASDPHASQEPVAPSGIWHIDIENTGPDVAIDAWIRRDDTLFGWPILGRQSYFDDGAYERFDKHGRLDEVDKPSSYVRRFGTLNGLATGSRPVVVGGWRRSDGAAARYSAAGPIIARPVAYPSPRVGADPDAAAVAEDSAARHGIVAAATRSNSAVAMGGTSVAAPQATRLIADWMATGKSTGRTEVEDQAAIEDAQCPKPVPSHRRIGAGRIFSKEPPMPPPRPPR
jgi:hypothetical protein